MEDFQLDIVVGKGPAASSIRLPLPPFTLVGATTRTGMITGPLRYASVSSPGSTTTTASCRRSSPGAGILDVAIDDAWAWEIVRRSRWHAAYRQPPASAGPRLRRGAR